MRGSVVVLAFAIAPFLAPVLTAQDTASTTSTKQLCQKNPGNPSTSGDENRTKKCPTPPPPQVGTTTISGIVFFDVDHDGSYITDEVGIASWQVVLTGPVNMTTMSDGNTGTYSFAGLPAGTYTVCVVPSPGWTQTSPAPGVACPSSNGFTVVAPVQASDSTIPNINFGFYSN
jgi:hypothetical protein